MVTVIIVKNVFLKYDAVYCGRHVRMFRTKLTPSSSG